MEELKPCPFCGGPPTMTGMDHGPEEVRYFVECMHCEARGASVISVSHTVKRHAAQLWNRRVEPRPTGAKREKEE
jgi:Lar family restriction alleviation protein